MLSETAYAVVLQCRKLRGGASRTIFGFARDRLKVAAMLFYRPCPRFRPPRDCFRTAGVGLCLPERTKAISRHSSRKKTLTRYGIILRALALVALFYWSRPRFRPPGEYFRTTKMGFCLLERSKAFSRHGSREKTLTRYGIIATCGYHIHSRFESICLI